MEIVGAVLIGGAVEVGRSDSLQSLEIVVVEVFAAIEHQVFEEVRETGLAGLLIFRAHVIPDVHGDNRRLVVFVHDYRQAVRQHELFVWNIKLRYRRRGGARLREGESRGGNQTHHKA